MAAIAEISVPRSDRTISVSTGLFINNEFVPSTDPNSKIELDHHLIYIPPDQQLSVHPPTQRHQPPHGAAPVHCCRR